MLDELERVGVDYDEAMQSLEDAAVAKFEASWAHLSEHLGETLRVQQAQKRG